MMRHAGGQADGDVGVLDDVQLATEQLLGRWRGTSGAREGAEGGRGAGQVQAGLLGAIQSAAGDTVAVVKLLDVEALACASEA